MVPTVAKTIEVLRLIRVVEASRAAPGSQAASGGSSVVHSRRYEWVILGRPDWPPLVQPAIALPGMAGATPCCLGRPWSDTLASMRRDVMDAMTDGMAAAFASIVAARAYDDGLARELANRTVENENKSQSQHAETYIQSAKNQSQPAVRQPAGAHRAAMILSVPAATGSPPVATQAAPSAHTPAPGAPAMLPLEAAHAAGVRDPFIQTVLRWAEVVGEAEAAIEAGNPELLLAVPALPPTQLKPVVMTARGIVSGLELPPEVMDRVAGRVFAAVPFDHHLRLPPWAPVGGSGEQPRMISYAETTVLAGQVAAAAAVAGCGHVSEADGLVGAPSEWSHDPRTVGAAADAAAALAQGDARDGKLCRWRPGPGVPEGKPCACRVPAASRMLASVAAAAAAAALGSGNSTRVAALAAFIRATTVPRDFARVEKRGVPPDLVGAQRYGEGARLAALRPVVGHTDQLVAGLRGTRVAAANVWMTS